MDATGNQHLIRTAIARVKQRRGSEQPPPASLANSETSSALMRRHLHEQWVSVIGPTLEEIADELEAAGFSVSLTTPGEATHGLFHIDGNAETHWRPSILFAVRDDGAGVDLTLTYGPIDVTPELRTVQPDDLTAGFVTSLVIRLIDDGL